MTGRGLLLAALAALGACASDRATLEQRAAMRAITDRCGLPARALKPVSSERVRLDVRGDDEFAKVLCLVSALEAHPTLDLANFGDKGDPGSTK